MGERSDNRPGNPNPDYQDRDIRLRVVLWFVVALFGGTGALLVLLAVFFQFMERRDPTDSDSGAGRTLPPEPRLLVDERQALNEYMDEMEEILENYAWRDGETGQVRIPIDRAIDLLNERGLPVRNASDAEGTPDARASDDNNESERTREN